MPIDILSYVIVELLPEWTRSRTARNLGRSVAKAVNPNKDLQQAAQNLAVADTVQNALRLAEYAAVIATLDQLKEANPGHRSP